jgi:hypothetical protein
MPESAGTGCEDEDENENDDEDENDDENDGENENDDAARRPQVRQTAAPWVALRYAGALMIFRSRFSQRSLSSYID